MLVKNWMSKRLVSIDPEASIAQANRLMSDLRIGRLAVMNKKGELVGIVSDRDIKRASASDANSLEVHELAYLLTRVKVSDIMTPNPLTVREDQTLGDAAHIMLTNKISGLPVMDPQGHPVAMLTQNDVFRALAMLTGVHQGGVQVAINMPDQSGTIKAACDIVRRYGSRTVSILTSYDPGITDRRNVYINTSGLAPDQADRLGKELGKLGKLLYVHNAPVPVSAAS